MSEILGRTRSDWADFMFSSLEIDKAQVGVAFFTLFGAVQESRKARNESVKGHCELALRMAHELVPFRQGEVSTLRMETGLLQGLVYLHKGIILMEQKENTAVACFETCLEFLGQAYPRERTLALIGKGLLEYWEEKAEDAVNTFQRARASAMIIPDPVVRATFNDKIDGLIGQGLEGLMALKPRPRAAPTSPQRARLSRQTLATVSLLPIGSSVAGGSPRAIDPLDGFTGYVEIRNVVIRGEEYEILDITGNAYVNLASSEQEHFVAKVIGDSMKGATIEDGDYVVLRRPRRFPLLPHSGDIVAVAFNNTDREVTLKRFEKKNGEFWLVPENPDYQTQHITSTDPQPDFVGVAFAVLKRIAP